MASQEFPDFFPELVRAGVRVNACSLNQLELYGAAFPGTEVGLRFNPGLGSGGTGKTNVGGSDSSFGIWHEQVPEVQALLAKYKLKAVRIHTHIGSGSDPAVWQRVSGMSLDLCRKFPDVHTLNLGGGKEENPRRDKEVPTTHHWAHLMLQVTRRPTLPEERAGLPHVGRCHPSPKVSPRDPSGKEHGAEVGNVCHVSKAHNLGHVSGTREEITMAIWLLECQKPQLRRPWPSF